ncbi:protein kinase family protein [Mycobacterium sp. JS623]|uniref:serine/threonine-protein kinase n=1 Tax=Mycobacterium sp. JS623 TaxID=212767 RepID=UPI0002A5950C|nr:serine/threonine-protein kinase [Mycobacterium sp. JS623]AGB21669.1 protein kinase family protein [Mycobacterium sp. JS623]
MSLQIGETFAGYRILRLLGSGGMGEVYLVQHPRLPRHDALKVLRPDVSSDTSFRERFIREAELAAGLRHPHIIAIHDRGEQDGQLWIAMDYIDGTDAAQLIEQRYPAGMPTELALPLITAVASALDYAHKKGLLHRDVKPANIIVTDPDSDDRQVFLADFGIARLLDDTSGITTTNMTVGTVAYAAPEQLMGEPMDGRADQYALAATAYHLLTGSQLFPHSNPAVVISRHLNTTPPSLSNRRRDCAGLDAVLQLALAKSPLDRFPSCSAFARALSDKSPGQGAASANATTRAAPQSRRSAPTSTASSPADAQGIGSRHAWVVLGSVAAIILLVGVVVLVWRPWQHPQSNTTVSSPSAIPTTSTPTSTTTALAPSPAAPPAVSVTAAPTTTTDQIESGPALGDECNDWMKFATDANGHDLLCGSVPPAKTMTWLSTETGPFVAAAHAPQVGKTGSPCNEPPYTFGRSSDGYSVWCYSGSRALMPGLRWLNTPDERPVWAVYSP